MSDTQLLLLLSPIILIELGMKIFALLNLRKQRETHGPKGVWVGVILLVSLGWLIYLLVGRKQDQVDVE